MTSSERFQRAQELFYAAIKLPADERQPFLDNICAGDDWLRWEVESLLAEDDNSSASLARRFGLNPPADEPVFSPGALLGPYEITVVVGRGGMGEVYRAHDTKLHRDVAVKVLPEAFARDQERVARLRREAQLLALVNNPHIAAIYTLEEHDQRLALIMEFVEGPTLADRIKQGRIPFDEALQIASQITEALEAVHEKGIIHRDLKPANVKLSPEGPVKILDFGLGKAPESQYGDQPTPGPTTLSRSGLILGTAAYMSPEQARGTAVDRRADVWSFGVLMYEMLTGERPFTGATEADIIATVLTREPDWSRIPREAQPSLRLCLEKDPKRRLRSLSDAYVLLTDRAPIRPQARNAWLLPSALALLAATAVWIGLRTDGRVEPASHSLVRLDVDLGAELPIGSDHGADVVLSPDGRRLVYVCQSRLFTRRLDESTATELAGTEGAYDPFFSPDGQWVGFFTLGKLKKVSVVGGAPLTLCDAGLSSGGSWGDDGNIVAAIDISGLSLIPSGGGAPQKFTQLGPGEAIHRWPQVLPGGAVLFSVYGSLSGIQDARIETVSLKHGQRRIVRRGTAWSRYVPTRQLLFLESDGILAAPFDVQRLELRGPSTPVLADVAHSALTGSVQLALSLNGVAVYRSRRSASQLVTVQRLDARGRGTALLDKTGFYLDPRLSPDGQRLVVTSNGDIWVDDLRRGTLTRLTFTGGCSNPIWTADGRFIVYRGPRSIFWIRADESAQPTVLISDENALVPSAFSTTASRLAFVELNAATGADLWTVPIENDGRSLRAGKAEIFLRTRFNERAPAFSPDGRWMAYSSDETGTLEVYVRKFPDNGGKIQVSDGGGNFPVWSKDSHRLFFTNGDLKNEVMVVNYTLQGSAIDFDKVRHWSSAKLSFSPPSRNYDVAADGKTVVAVVASDGGQRTAERHVIFLQNFSDELQRRVAPPAPRD